MKQYLLIILSLVSFSFFTITKTSNYTPQPLPFRPEKKQKLKENRQAIKDKQAEEQTIQEAIDLLIPINWNIKNSALAQRREDNSFPESLKEESRKQLEKNYQEKLKCRACLEAIWKTAQPTCKQHRTALN